MAGFTLTVTFQCGHGVAVSQPDDNGGSGYSAPWVCNECGVRQPAVVQRVWVQPGCARTA